MTSENPRRYSGGGSCLLRGSVDVEREERRIRHGEVHNPDIVDSRSEVHRSRSLGIRRFTEAVPYADEGGRICRIGGDIDAEILRTGKIVNTYEGLESREKPGLTERTVRARAGAGGPFFKFTVGDGTVNIRRAGS